MSLRILTRRLANNSRSYSTNAGTPSLNGRRRVRVGLISATALTGAASLLYLSPSRRDDDTQPKAPMSTLLRSYIVYTMCSFPTLIDHSPALLSTLMRIPLLNTITEAIVRATFFEQFVGGDTAKDAVALVGRMREEKKGVLFAYSIEVDEDELVKRTGAAPGTVTGPGSTPIHKQIVEEMIHSIDVSADFEDHRSASRTGRRTWVAVKMTALVPDPQSLINLSAYLIHTRPPASPVEFPGYATPHDLDILYSGIGEKQKAMGMGELSSEDISALRELHADLERICLRAEERGVRIIVDAEYSWYQPAIDAYTLALSKRFNALPTSHESSWWWPSKKEETRGGGKGEQPLVYGTYQAYLRRTSALLLQSLAAAKRDGYALGVKLVRGAYHTNEVAAHAAISSPHATKEEKEKHAKAGTPRSIAPPSPHPPVWLSKTDTDTCYNSCARMLVREVASDISPSGLWGGDKGKGTKGVGLGVLFGTHNWESCAVILKELVASGLAVPEGEKMRVGEEVGERVIFGQLYGMSDALTDSLVTRTVSDAPLVMKYVPYGALKDVMPYLSRRAIENKSVLGNGAAADERRRVGRAIRKKIFG